MAAPEGEDGGDFGEFPDGMLQLVSGEFSEKLREHKETIDKVRAPPLPPPAAPRPRRTPSPSILPRREGCRGAEPGRARAPARGGGAAGAGRPAVSRGAGGRPLSRGGAGRGG